MSGDTGAPASYLTLTEGTPVLAAGGEPVGVVRRVLADEGADVFDGLIVETDDGERFVDAPHVGDLYERAAFLTLSADEARELHEPEANPAVMAAEPDDAEESPLRTELRRAWDLISGKY